MTIQNTIQNWCDAPEIHPSQIRVGDIIGTLRPTEKRFRVKMIGPPQASPGRWTFFGSDNGGKTAAVLRSFISYGELVKADPFAWFRDVLGRIAEHPMSRLGELLPHRWAQAPR